MIQPDNNLDLSGVEIVTKDISINRMELIHLRERCDEIIRTKGLNGRWKKAYQQVAEAVDRLDAMKARTEVVAD